MTTAVAGARPAPPSIPTVAPPEEAVEPARRPTGRRARRTGITPIFPLWGRPTDRLAGEVIDAGVRAVLTCVDPAGAPDELAGRWYDRQLLADLPPHVDPCGENGEFHTLVVDGPGFGHRIDVSVGEVVERGGFVYADVLPAAASAE